MRKSTAKFGGHSHDLGNLCPPQRGTATGGHADKQTDRLMTVLRQLYRERVLPVGSPCAVGWHHYSAGDSCFYASTTEVSQQVARDECQKLGTGADLASISDQPEMDFVTSIL